MSMIIQMTSNIINEISAEIPTAGITVTTRWLEIPAYLLASVKLEIVRFVFLHSFQRMLGYLFAKFEIDTASKLDSSIAGCNEIADATREKIAIMVNH